MRKALPAVAVAVVVFPTPISSVISGDEEAGTSGTALEFGPHAGGNTATPSAARVGAPALDEAN